MDQFKIAGIDVSAGSVMVCVLSEIPHDIRTFKQKYRPLKFKANQEGIEALLALDFVAAVMEPTGGHYSKIWAIHLERAGKIIRWVGHREIVHYRNSWREFNKDDRIDSIMLACYGIERWNRPNCFIEPCQERIQELYLKLEHLNRTKSPSANRLKQQLNHEFPEAASKMVKRKWLKHKPPGLWLAIAGEGWSEKWRKEYEATIGTGISDFSQFLAQRLCEIERYEYGLEIEIQLTLEQSEEYKPYLKVFERYSISERTAAALLSVIYPIEQFLDDGEIKRIHKIGKQENRVTRNVSLGSFKLACGVGQVYVQSGKKEGWKAGGSKYLRTALWRWCKTAVVMHPNLELEAIAKLHQYYERGTESLVDHKQKYDEPKHFDPSIGDQRVMRVVRRMLHMLFRDLVEMSKSQSP